MFENYLFYDIEVFSHNSMVVFKDYDGKTVKVFSSSIDGLGELFDKGISVELGYKNLKRFIRGKTLVGYNNYWYDDYILYAMSQPSLNPFIKKWNDNIIKNLDKTGMTKISICKTLDAFQQIDVSRPSLKKVEGNMGLSIIESNVSFDIDRPLTPAENLETFLYCEYDVAQTLKIFKMREQYFKSKQAIIEMIEDKSLHDRAYKWNTTSIVGQILTPKLKAPTRRLISDSMMSNVPTEVQEMWKQLDTWKIGDTFKKKKVIVEKHGIIYEFGWGGLHGAANKVVKAENVKLKDVTSMYPNIIINLKGLGDKTKDYQDILNTSTRLKHEGRKAEREPFKLILNSTYGLLNNQYSQLNNPWLAYSVCIYGQIALFTLCERLANVGATIINVNTDGVAYTINGEQDESIVAEWEHEFKLQLETDAYDKWIQKDVNNYIAIAEDGYMTLKGGDVNKYYKDNNFKNNDIRIVHIALVDYLTKGVPVQETILNNLDKPRLFQYILKAGSTYDGVVFKHDSDTLLNTKVNRVFATKNEYSVEILKKRFDGGIVKFADTPTKQFLWNDDVETIPNFEKMIDKQWYYDLTMQKLKAWV